jgi:hypothetical protein
VVVVIKKGEFYVFSEMENGIYKEGWNRKKED